MFWNEYPVWKSSVLCLDGVGHAFSSRAGGSSRAAHTRSMNVAFFRGDDDLTVKNNIKALCVYAGISDNVVASPQMHTTDIRIVTSENGGEGIDREAPDSCDGFITDCPGVSLLIRTADCAPILLAGTRADGTVVVGAVHAGWRGTAGGIAPKAVSMMRDMGAEKIFAAIGPCIHSCCYQVGEDMRDSVAALRGRDFADRHIVDREGKLYADIVGMNEELLRVSGVTEIDILSECTACKPWLYHSHRVTGGIRGALGAVIGIR